MTWRIFLIVGLLLAALLATVRAQFFSQFPPGVFQTRAALDGSATSYTGLGDLAGLSAPVAYWGTDGITNAYTGNALNVCDAAGANCGNFTVLNGQLQVSNRGATDCHGGTCVIATIYDQTAGGNCTGSCDLIQSVNGVRWTLTFNCPTSGHWCITSPGGSVQGYKTAAAMTVSSPLTITEAANNTFTSAQVILVYDSANISLQYNLSGAANDVFIFEGSLTPTATVSDGSWHSITGLYNNASSDIVVDGTSNAVNTGASTGISGRIVLGCSSDNSCGQIFTGTFCNAAIYSFGVTSGEKTAISTNQHSFACGGGF